MDGGTDDTQEISPKREVLCYEYSEQRVYDALWLVGLRIGRAKVLTATLDGESSVLLFSLGNGLLLGSG